MISQQKIKKLAQRRHPEYDRLLPHWRFLQSTYVGGREWFDSNIFQFYKEGEEYANRVKRAYRFNHTREVVDLVNKYLFKGKVDRIEDEATETVKEFWQNVNGEGMNIDEFMRVLSLRSSIAGCPWVVVDSKQTEIDENTTKSEEIPDAFYAYIIMPEKVLDLSWGEDGELNWILIEETIRDDEDPWESSGDTLQRYRLWTRNKWYLYEPEFSNGKYLKKYLSTEGQHDLGVVPVFRADNLISDDPYSSPALINDIAYLDRAVANYLSNLDEIIQDQTFSQLAMPAQGILPGEEDENGNDKHEELLKIGTKRIFTYDGEHGVAPMFLSPDPRQAQLIISAIQQIINEIYHSVGLAGERTKQDNSKGIDNSSGVAKAKDFERVNSLLVAKADALESAENKLVRLVSLWAGEKVPDSELIKYPESFNARGLFDEFDIASQLSLIEVPESIRGKQLYEVIDKLFPSMSRKEKDQLRKEVDSWVEDIKEQAKAMKEMAKGIRNDGEELRNREVSGDRQSKTKEREAKRVKEQDQESGQ